MLLLRKTIMAKSNILAELDAAETTINVAAKSSGAGIGSCGYQPQLYKKTSFTKVIFHLNLYTANQI